MQFSSWELASQKPTVPEYSAVTPIRINQRIPSENNFARKRIFQATGEKILSKDDAFDRHHVKQVFTNKIAMSKRVSCNMGTFAMVADVFCDQLVNDLLAYKAKKGKDQEGNSQNESDDGGGESGDDDNDDEVNMEDIMLLMRRQRVLSEQNSLESLIYKHLPRELWDDLAISALADNLLSDERENAPCVIEKPENEDYFVIAS
ncbi:hypothetical protein BY458DRAFT_489538 [Sporodiniella umbellata]|nr:hypothetical protein BY458DRAFT_489538 [Sporodiniella umbellata]